MDGSLYVWLWDGMAGSPFYPDTPANRRHLHTLAMDWCAHGVRWCDATTATGLPKRGAMSLWEALLHVRAASEFGPEYVGALISWRRLRNERRAVEVTDG